MMDTRRNYFLMVAVAIALVAAGCAPLDTGPQYEVIMDPDAPVTEAPASYGIGSTWVFNHTLNGETVQIPGRSLIGYNAKVVRST